MRRAREYLKRSGELAAKLFGFILVPELYYLGRSFYEETLRQFQLLPAQFPKTIDTYLYDGAAVAATAWSVGFFKTAGFLAGLAVLPFVIAGVAVAFWSPGDRGVALAQSRSLFSKAKDRIGFLAYFAAAILVPTILYFAAWLAITLLSPSLEQAAKFAEKTRLRVSACEAIHSRADACSRVFLSPSRFRDGVIVAASDARIAIAVKDGVRIIKADDVFGIGHVPSPPTRTPSSKGVPPGLPPDPATSSKVTAGSPHRTYQPAEAVERSR